MGVQERLQRHLQREGDLPDPALTGGPHLRPRSRPEVDP